MGGLAQRKESSFRSLSYPPSMHLSFTFNNHFYFFVFVVVVVVVVFFSFLPFFFLDKDVCTCSFEPLEHFFYILLLQELKWLVIVLYYKLLCFTWISIPEKTLNTSCEIMIFFSSVFDLVNQFLTRKWLNGKAFTVLIPRLFVKIFSDYGCSIIWKEVLSTK